MSSELENPENKYFKALQDSNLSDVEDLLTTGAIDVNFRNPNFFNRSALHIAACNGNLDLVHLLVDKFHASVNITDERGQIPLQVATDYRNIDIVKFLLERGSNHREYASQYINSEEVENLFKAAENNEIEEVIRLLNVHNLDVNTENRSNWNRTVLEIAATQGSYDLVQVLVDEFHADVNHYDDLEENALIMARNNHHDNIANFLLERGSTSVVSESSEESDFSLNLSLT